LQFNEKGFVINNFDKFEAIDQSISLLNLQEFLLKFDTEELENLLIKDLLTIDLDEYESIINKLKKFKDIGEEHNDNEIKEFFETKIQVLLL